MEINEKSSSEIKFDWKYRTRRDTRLIFLFIISQIVALLALIVTIFVKFLKLFIPKRQKCVKDKLALITGSGNGLGRLIALKLAKKGCNIVVVDIDYAAALSTVNEINEKFDVKALAYHCDVANYEEVMEMKKFVESSMGFVDMLINNAGVLGFDVSLREKRPENIRKIIDVNLMSHFWTVRAFLDTMIERKSGHIIAMCSFAGKVTFPHSISYCTSKFGLTGFMSALYDELCTFGQDDFIKTTTIYPCMIATKKEIFDVIGSAPVWSPEEAAEICVKGILKEDKNVYVPGYSRWLTIINLYPNRIYRFLKMAKVHNEIVELRKNGIF